jgi:subtilisin family serine protease
MAAPHVSGAGVLLRRAQPSLTPPEVERVIVADAAPSGIVWTGRY